MNTDELDALRKKRIQELQNNNADTQRQEADIKAQIAELEAMVRPRLSREAQSRYANLKMAFPEKSVQALVVLAKYIQATGKEVSDEQLKDLLIRLEPEKREIKITRK